jgi:hypothetical protein
MSGRPHGAALRRAKERAADEGRTLGDVVGDRWGSVAQLVAGGLTLNP